MRACHAPATVALAALALLAAEPAKPDAKDAPKIVVAAPLGLPPGKPTKLLLRGLKLDEATEVRLHDPKGTAKILSKGKAPLGQQGERRSAALRRHADRNRGDAVRRLRRADRPCSPSSRRPANRRRTP